MAGFCGVSASFAEDFSVDATLEEAGDGPRDDEQRIVAGETQYETSILARIGQNKFAEEVKAFWIKCAVTEIESLDLPAACHIKPFRDCGDAPSERLDPYNGVCLAAHIHKAFDANLICFTPDGLVVFSESFSMHDRERMNLRDGMCITVTARHRPYLEHRYDQFRRQESDKAMERRAASGLVRGR